MKFNYLPPGTKIPFKGPNHSKGLTILLVVAVLGVITAVALLNGDYGPPFIKF